MFPSLMMFLLLAGRFGFDQMQPPSHRSRELPLQGFRHQFDREFLESTKRYRIFLEEEIAECERSFREFPELYKGDHGTRRREHVEFLRKCLQHGKKMEQVLEWYQRESKENPGSATDKAFLVQLVKLSNDKEAWLKAWERGQIAPPPREVKR